MKVSIIQRVIASDYLYKIWVLLGVIIVPCLIIEKTNVSMDMISISMGAILIFVLICGAGIGYLLAGIAGGMVFPILEQLAMRLNGGPFREEDDVLIIGGEHKGCRGKIEYVDERSNRVILRDPNLLLFYSSVVKIKAQSGRSRD